jgi:hypothetical protein
MALVRQLDVVGVPAAAGDESLVFDTPNRLSGSKRSHDAMSPLTR